MEHTITLLRAAENKETFFRRISALYPTRDERYRAIAAAYEDAKDAFRGVERESGERYFEHLRAVALIIIDKLRVTDHEIIIAALLHDIVEDNEHWTFDRVEHSYGPRVTTLLEWITKPPKAEFGGDKEARDRWYHDRFDRAPRDFFLIKLPDRLHNLWTLDACPAEKRVLKLRETEQYYIPQAIRQILLIDELEHAVAKIKSANP